MEAMLIRERYKVTQVLWTLTDYALLEAVDIQDREMPSRLLNVYEGSLLGRYAQVFDRMHHCEGYYGMFLTGQSLVAVFAPAWGRTIDQVFYKGDKWTWQQRLDAAGLLLHRMLTMTDLPPEVSCAALLSDNLIISPEEGHVWLRFMICPMEGMDHRELCYLATDQVKKILRRRFYSGGAELTFLQELDRDVPSGPVPLYARWLEAKDLIQAEYELLDKKNHIKRWFYFLWNNLRRGLRKKRADSGVR